MGPICGMGKTQKHFLFAFTISKDCHLLNVLFSFAFKLGSSWHTTCMIFQTLHALLNSKDTKSRKGAEQGCRWCLHCDKLATF